MTLVNLEVKELSLREKKEVEGGFPWVPVIILVAAFAAGVYEGYQEAKDED